MKVNNWILSKWLLFQNWKFQLFLFYSENYKMSKHSAYNRVYGISNKYAKNVYLALLNLIIYQNLNK